MWLQVGVMKNLPDNSQHEESTYALLMRSQEKNRNLLEMTIYPLLIAAGLMAIWGFAQQTIDIPATGIVPAGLVAVCGPAHVC